MGIENTIWDAEDYNNTNKCQYRDAKELIELIKENEADSKADEVIVDIGCGSGNVTKMLSRRPSCKKIFACDFDAQMVKFANENNKNEKIEYFLQNISLPWELLEDKLKNLEGKVDIVWSNLVLHWVSDKATAVKTITRLLKPGGRCFCTIALIRDLNEFASDAERKEHEKYFNFVPHEEQARKWESYFKTTELSQVNIEFIEKQWTCESNEQMKTFLPTEHLVKLMVNTNFERLSEEDKTTCVKTMRVKCFSSLESQYGKNPLENNDETSATFYYEMLRVVGKK